MELKSLFKPIKLGQLEVPNRVVLAPMGTSLYSPDDTWPRRTIRYFEERAIGGVGLILTSFTRVHDKLATGSSPLTGIYDDRLIPSHQEMTGKVHKHGSKIILQIALHGCKFGGAEAPSSIYSLNYNIKPRELTTDELDFLIDCFIKAGDRAYEAGYDGVEVHGGYSYLIGQMISPALNLRQDKYGGSFENRMKFPVDIIKGIQKRHPDFTVGFKYSAYEWLPGGVDLDLAKKMAEYVVSETGVHFLDIASSSSTTMVKTSKYSHVPPVYIPRNTLMPLAEAIKKTVPNIPVLANGAISVPQEADEAIEAGKCDMVAVGRALIADPHWARKAESGNSRSITPCIRCNICHHQLWLGTPLCCSVNPYVLKESDQYLPEPVIKKKVMVIGAGPAGMRAAITAAKRGHEVTIYEKSDHVGGMMYPGSRPAFKDDVGRALEWFKYELEQNKVEVRLNTTVTPELVEKTNPDALVIAIGAAPIMPDVPGMDKPHVDSAVNILTDISKYKGSKAVVVGGGEVGCETACFLADNGYEVTLVEVLRDILVETEITEIKLRLTDLMKEKNVKVMTETKLNAITDEGAEVIVPYDTQMGLAEGGREEGLDADLVAIAVNQKADQDLIKILSMKALEVHTIGDCVNVARIREAVEAGELVGRTL
ncbi:MAG: NAD(P)/FAD-dependent oxidoreductase [Actinomycetota bacterium]|nr:NAD(P)/FAD-dependent oxidoreductase [Actinomycetota bacterium]